MSRLLDVLHVGIEHLISIINYGLSNLSCVLSAVQRLGFEVQIVQDAEAIKKASMLILPGVGAFGDAMSNLNELGLVQPLNDAVIKRQVPFLGICLGAQLICSTSDEFGDHEGLGWISADVRQLDVVDQKLRVPHTGWDEIEVDQGCAILNDIPSDSLFYYNHSHAIYPHSDDHIIAHCDYGDRFASILQKDNIYATQFHPEKSQKIGLEMLQNFFEIELDTDATQKNNNRLDF